MGSAMTMVHTLCAICDTDRWDRVLYPATMNDQAATAERFSARRTPDRVHYRVVRCGQCGLVRSDPVLPEDELLKLYQGSRFDHPVESQFAAETYARCVAQIMPQLPDRDALLEIGCGNGAFLKAALDLGFKHLFGVEPSRRSVECAPTGLRERILNVGFRDGLFPPNSFSVVCGFQVLDHLAAPLEVVHACLKLLRPGGVAFFLNHDAGAWTNRLLGSRSPIIDIEHIYLFDQKTVSMLFAAAGFEVLRTFRVVDRHPLAYWLRLSPLPQWLSKPLIASVNSLGLGSLPVAWKAGNLAIVARRKPEEAV